MQISSVRLGHANNSSSTHSILLNSTAPENKCVEDYRYGWEWFHLKNRTDKAKYLATLVYTVLSREMSSYHAAVIAKELTGIDLRSSKTGGEEGDFYAYVDHQSVNAFPLKFGTQYYDNQFMKEFVEYVRDTDAISIYGGNDNENDGLDAYEIDGERSPLNYLPRDCGKIPLFARKDGAWWTLYNRDTGAKIRISFDANAPAYTCASRPELVDVKITDFCPVGCAFCYQGSTVQGKHADMQTIWLIAYACHHAKVFEVAIGGGEPTMHPKFVDILRIFSSQGVTPNFTSFSMKWSMDNSLSEAVKKYCASFAISSLSEVQNLADWNASVGLTGVRGTLQVPIGCYSKEETVSALDRAKELGVPVTLLGYKRFGRGKTFEVHDYSWILDYLYEKGKYTRFGADTVFVEQFGELLKKKGVSPKLMVSREGAFSCYIDAVEKKMGASSYTTELHDMPSNGDIFQKFPYAA